MNPFRCQICGETYLGGEAPDRCPFCGASGKHLLDAAEWHDHGKVEMSENSYKNCEESLKLELSNLAFYKCCAENAENQVTEAIFKRLSKQEGEHAELICEMMGIDEPDPPKETCGSKDEDNFKESHKREKRAMNFYLQIVREAEEPRVQEVFKALSEIEGEHLRTGNLFK